MITELLLQSDHIQQLEQEICAIVEQARQRQILCSMGLGPIQAARLVAAIGSIENFPIASTLKAYFGWALMREQTGTSFDRSRLTRGGSRPLRQTMFLIMADAVSHKNNEWGKFYHRLFQIKCPVDALTGERKGKMRVIGRVAGQMIETMYTLLKTDAEVLRALEPGATPPPPTLYDPEAYRHHRAGHYRPMKPSSPANHIVLLSKSS
ncbi:transposase [Tengunoibacter tsumagoiensis]|uniref:Transposase IS116/IS110/IS902 C-terminal domain-containing protein n=1 Tax=Tengunoibacter tsumagoiensis TaxID=2014871 RepID=A0A402A0B4_9CHLR|nr:transposase [Tengunoibacter tsumagoiensis]GCE12496.1 hypothetical protein KTT_23550 [Tengunoibacter tsumagoiensis]